jgi:hypothetical protein
MLYLKPRHDQVLRALTISAAMARLGAHSLIYRDRDRAARHAD